MNAVNKYESARKLGENSLMVRSKFRRRIQFEIKDFKKCWQFYLIILLPLIYIIIFSYTPMFGISLAFKSFQIKKGILGSPWVGFRYFEQFFKSPQFWLLLKNTLGVSVYSLLAGFPFPIILALALNEVSNTKFKKFVQTVTYAPHFISTVVMVSIIMQFLSPRIGAVNIIIQAFGGTQQNFIGDPDLFKSIYVWSGIWQNTGYEAIIYLAAVSSIDPSLYEAARVDGASIFKKIVNIDIPGILPTIVILLIINCGRIMSVGFEKIYLMQNALNASSSEVFATYVYKIGLISAQYSFSTAVSLFNSVVNLILILSVNSIAKRVGETSLW